MLQIKRHVIAIGNFLSCAANQRSPYRREGALQYPITYSILINLRRTLEPTTFGSALSASNWGAGFASYFVRMSQQFGRDRFADWLTGAVLNPEPLPIGVALQEDGFPGF